MDEAFPLWFRLGAGFGVLLLWSVSVVFDMTSSAYETPAPIHGLAAIVVGGIFGREVGRAVASRINDK